MATPVAVHDADVALGPFELALADPAFTTVIAPAGGPPLWHTIHNLARAYKPATQRELMATWLKTTAALMWCEACAHHFGEMVKTADLSSAAAFLAWTVRTHNAVNERLGKPVLSDAAAIAAIRAAGVAPATATSTMLSTTPTSAPTVLSTTPAGVSTVMPRSSILSALHCQSPLGWQITVGVFTCIILVLACICAWLGVKLRKK